MYFCYSFCLLRRRPSHLKALLSLFQFLKFSLFFSRETFFRVEALYHNYPPIVQIINRVISIAWSWNTDKFRLYGFLGD